MNPLIILSLSLGVLTFLYTLFWIKKYSPKYASFTIRDQLVYVFIVLILLGFFLWHFRVGAFLIPALPPTALAITIDQRVHLLPNRLVLASVVLHLGALAVFQAGIPNPQQKTHSWTFLALVLAITLVVLGILLFVGIGMGDLKFAPALVLWAAATDTLPQYLFILAILPALYLIFRRIAGHKDKYVAYGPWLYISLPLALSLSI
ncbi:hypothetical protein BSR28_04090 [Boudabousia liubingyangii]|uniref:prepilin peptidase n=1 Tax=Boudabousia liubingyangii TaxID=1921764 RepID=UPI00093908AD|nr:prepilin peptidase [Boudabousia liubingyangii]OKL47677.1 hypothetical protein BSR28_04090 [Boudabousia liubingyangii]